MRPERFTASLFSSYDGLLIFGESLISASGDALAADRVSGPERPHPAIPSPRRTAFHPTEPIRTGIANGRCGGNLSHPPDTGVSAAERRFPIFPSSLPNEGLRPKRLLIAHKRQLGECPDAVVARRGSDRAVARYRHTPVAGRASWAKRLICGRRGEQTCRGQSRSARSHAVVLARDAERGMGQKGPRHFHCSANAIKT